MFGEDDLVKSHKSRGDLIFNIIVVAFLVLVARLWYLQVVMGDQLWKFSLENRLRKEIVRAPRGMIFSRNNQLLTHNTSRFDAIIIPQYLKNKNETLDKLASILEMERESIDKILKRNQGQASYLPVVIKKNISQRELAVIETENAKMPGVVVDTFISREYSDGEVGAHMLGYIGEISQTQLPKYQKRDNYDYKLGDFIGQAGIEEKFDSYLRGEDGYEFMEVDARGRMKRHISSNEIFAGIQSKPAISGNNIRLTIDRDLQLAAFNALEGRVGSAVAVDVRTGEVLAMVNRPSFDPTRFSKGITSEYWETLTSDKRNPLLDRSIQEHYSPGSTFKTFTAIAALEEGVIKADEQVMCGPTYRLGRRVFHDWKRNGHGLTDVYKSLAHSVDVYFYKIAVVLDIDILATYAKSFGFGTKTEVTLPREIPGLIPTKEWKKKRNGEEWQLGETLSCVIGQSYVLATPIQLAMAYAAIANGGKLYRPHLVKEIFSNSGDVVKRFEPELVGQAKVSEQTLKAIRRGLNEVVNKQGGTAWWYRGRGIRMAGKTGTSQVKSMTKKELFSRCEEMPYESRHHGIFVGFAPYENPEIAVAAVVEHGCHGSSAGAPVAREVITTYMKKYKEDLYKQYLEEDMREYRQMIQRQKAAAQAQAEAEAATPEPTEAEE